MLPDPEVRRRADLLRHVVSMLRAIDVTAVERLTGADTWTGPVAESFAMRVARTRRVLDECADALAARARHWDTVG